MAVSPSSRKYPIFIRFCKTKYCAFELEAGRVNPGDRILLAAFGAGLTRAAGLLRWGDRTKPLKHSDAELPPCDQTAVEILHEAIKDTI